MSLEYYMFCKEKYEEIILNLENIIDLYDLIIDYTIGEDKLDFINSLNHTKQLKKVCENKIRNLCVHEYETDTIDITPERSESITFCKFCGLTK